MRDLRRLRMKFGGRIPDWAWNALLDIVQANSVESFVGGRVARGRTGVRLRSKKMAGGSAAQESHPYKPYGVPFTGEGEPPANQGLKVKLIPGTVDGNLASNYSDTFTLEADVTGKWVWLAVTVDQNGLFQSALIDKGDTPPVAEEPGEDGALPPILYQPLFSYDSSATAVTRVYQVTDENLRIEVNTNQALCEQSVRSIRLAEN